MFCSCRPQQEVFWYGYIIPIGLNAVVVCLLHIYSLYTLFTYNLHTAEGEVRKDAVLPHYIVGVILHGIFAVVWIFALTGTDYYVEGTPSIATQYVFAFLAMIHALAILVLTLFRDEDIRTTFMRIVNGFCGRNTGKYDFASEPQTIINEGHQLGEVREGSIKMRSMKDDDEYKPLDDQEVTYAHAKLLGQTNSFTPGTFHVSVNVLHTCIHVLYYNIILD